MNEQTDVDMNVPEITAQPESESKEAGPVLNRSQRREKAACDALRTLLRDRYVQQFGGDIPENANDIDMVLRLKIAPSNNWSLHFEPDLNEQLSAQIEDFQAQQDVFQQGHVYCFRCNSSTCEHAAPPDTLHVFKGYSEMGVPEWNEFAQVLLEQKDERVDRIFSNKGAAIARMQLGKELRLNQLSSFGRSSKTYAILGQTIAGYYNVTTADKEQTRLAITFQIVEARGAGGKVRVQLNVLAGLSNQNILELIASDWNPTLYRAYDMAQRDVKRMERQVQLAREAGRNDEVRKALQRVPGVLRKLAESLERGARQSSRRTHHAEIRRQDQRPVHKAMDDAAKVSLDNTFFDKKSDTMIVCGNQGRAHAFNRDGKHVTSFVLKPGGVDFRLRTGRWRRVEQNELMAFKELILHGSGCESVVVQRPV